MTRITIVTVLTVTMLTMFCRRSHDVQEISLTLGEASRSREKWLELNLCAALM